MFQMLIMILEYLAKKCNSKPKLEKKQNQDYVHTDELNTLRGRTKKLFCHETERATYM